MLNCQRPNSKSPKAKIMVNIEYQVDSHSNISLILLNYVMVVIVAQRSSHSLHIRVAVQNTLSGYTKFVT